MDDTLALDRAIDKIPYCANRDMCFAALLDDAYDDGIFPKFDTLKTVGAIRMLGAEALAKLPGMTPDTAAWLLTEFGGEIPPMKSNGGPTEIPALIPAPAENPAQKSRKDNGRTRPL